MTPPLVRSPARDPRDPVSHELDPIRFEGGWVPLRLIVRRADDGAWRGRLQYGDEGGLRETSEILCGDSEPDLWLAVRRLGEHHLRDLYRSLL
jgi:hypothetical protein